MNQASQYTIKGGEKNAYMRQVNSALAALVSAVSGTKNIVLTETLREFGKKHEWDWSRIPNIVDNPAALAEQIKLVQEQYQWLDWLTFPNEPQMNRGYVDEIEINSNTGLPWQYNFITLQRLKEQSPQLLEEMPSYDQSAQQLADMLKTDDVSIDQVVMQAGNIQTAAMKRNFLEQLTNAELVGYNLIGKCKEPKAVKIERRGGETCWAINLVSYSLASGMFQIYIIHAWEEMLHSSYFTETENGVEIAPMLKASLNFSEENTGWFIISKLDEDFPGLHPFHVTRALIGPFENRFLTSSSNPYQRLPVTGAILKDDQNAGILRASIQYSFAPNTINTKEGVKQELYMEDWRDEFIVCPSQYSAQVSGSVEGQKVRVVKY